jgi:indolepyruvate ferredoxin oxidoreductase alpha subunit
MHFGFETGHGSRLARNSVAVIGDSTFIHSGITPLIDMVYNKGTGTVIILDNRHRHDRPSGKSAEPEKNTDGRCTRELDFEQLARSVGVRRVRIIDTKEEEFLEQALREEVAAEEPSVIITKRKCILKK